MSNEHNKKFCFNFYNQSVEADKLNLELKSKLDNMVGKSVCFIVEIIDEESYAVRCVHPDPFFNDGAYARFEGVDLNECSFDEGTDGQEGWCRGWKAMNELMENVENRGKVNNE